MNATTLIEKVAAAVRADGWENVILGMGGSKDPSVYTTFHDRGAGLNEVILEALYVEDHFAAKLVEALPRDAMRPGWSMMSGGPPEDSAALKAAYRHAEAHLRVVEEISQGAVWGRVFGGAITWIGADDGRPTHLPLDEGRIKSIKFLHTFDRRDVVIHKSYNHPNDEKFQDPEIYRVYPQASSGQIGAPIALPGGAILHESRVVEWGGQPTTDRRRQILQGWDDSVLERSWDALRQVAEDYGAKGLLLGRVAQGIYKIRDFYAMIAGKREEVLRARMSMIDASRSRSRAILLDTEEDFVNVTQPLGGVDSMVNLGLIRLAASGDMPVAVLLGQPLSALEGIGQGDLEVWGVQVEAWRRLVLGPRHSRIAKLIMLAKDGPTGGVLPEDWAIDYAPLRMPGAKDLAEIRKLETETDAIRVDKGFATPEAIALQRFSPSAGSDLVLDEAELKANLERRRELAKQPPKDNAELGTVAPRDAAVRDTVSDVNIGRISRESGAAILMEVHRYTEETASKLLGPVGFSSSRTVLVGGALEAADPQLGQGAGAPQGMPEAGAAAPDRAAELRGLVKDQGVKIADTALNGAQVTALREIITDVATGVIDKATAAKLITAGFPLSIEEAVSLVSGIQVKPPVADPAPAPTEPTEP